MVNWKEIPKIDAHIHLLPSDVICANSGNGDPFVDYGGVKEYLNIMEEYNIECAFVMPFNDPYMLSMDFTIETVHSNLQEMMISAPTKLFCFEKSAIPQISVTTFSVTLLLQPEH